MRRLYSIKLKKASAHRQKTKRKKELKRIHERNFENSGNFKRKKELKRIHEKNFENSTSFPRNFQFG